MRPGPEADGLRHKAGARERARTRDGRRLGCREGRRGNTRRSCAGMGSTRQTNTRFANATRDAHADESRTPTKGGGRGDRRGDAAGGRRGGGCCPRQRERGAPSRGEVAGGRSAWATRGGRVPVGSAAQVERVIARDAQRQTT